MRSVADAALACGREVVCVGRAMDRVVATSRRELRHAQGPAAVPLARISYGLSAAGQGGGAVDGQPGRGRAPRSPASRATSIPRSRCLPGDRVIFSSRTIPGNEKEVGAIVNGLYRQGIEVITDRTHLVHVSGHPRRDEVKQLYEWIRPKVADPGPRRRQRISPSMPRSHGRRACRMSFGPSMARSCNFRETPGVVDQVQSRTHLQAMVRHACCHRPTGPCRSGKQAFLRRYCLRGHCHG